MADQTEAFEQRLREVEELLAVAGIQGVMPGEVAAALGLSQRATTRLIGRLVEQRGIVRPTPKGRVYHRGAAPGRSHRKAVQSKPSPSFTAPTKPAAGASAPDYEALGVLGGSFAFGVAKAGVMLSDAFRRRMRRAANQQVRMTPAMVNAGASPAGLVRGLAPFQQLAALAELVDKQQVIEGIPDQELARLAVTAAEPDAGLVFAELSRRRASATAYTHSPQILGYRWDGKRWVAPEERRAEVHRAAQPQVGMLVPREEAPVSWPAVIHTSEMVPSGAEQRWRAQGDGGLRPAVQPSFPRWQFANGLPYPPPYVPPVVFDYEKGDLVETEEFDTDRKAGQERAALASRRSSASQARSRRALPYRNVFGRPMLTARRR